MLVLIEFVVNQQTSNKRDLYQTEGLGGASERSCTQRVAGIAPFPRELGERIMNQLDIKNNKSFPFSLLSVFFHHCNTSRRYFWCPSCYITLNGLPATAGQAAFSVEEECIIEARGSKM